MRPGHRAIFGAAFVLLGTWAWATAARAEEDLTAWWSNTPAAAAESASPVHLGQAALALAIVVGLLLLLAWGLRRLHARRTLASGPAGSPEKIWLRARFNASQTLVIWEREGEVQCLILKGKRVEFQAGLPNAGVRSDPPAAVSPKKSAAFQDVWRTLISGSGPETGGPRTHRNGPAGDRDR